MDMWSEAVLGRDFTRIPYSERTKGLLTSPALSSEHPETSHNSLLDLDGPAQQHLHRTIAQYLRRPPTSTEVAALLDRRIQAFGESGDLVHEVVHPVVAEVVFDAFEVSPQLRAVVAPHLEAAVGALDPFNASARSAAGALLVDMFRASHQPQEGLFGDLLALAEAGHVTRKQAIAAMVVSLHGGLENPVLLLASYLVERFAGHQLTAVEALRLFAPVRAVARYVRTDITIDACPYQAAQPLWVELGADGDRSLPFGFGPHGCPGSSFATRLLDAWVAYDWEAHGFEVTAKEVHKAVNSHGVVALHVVHKAPGSAEQ